MVITWTYANQIAFHIPHYAWADEKLVPIDYKMFKKAILDSLAEHRVNGAYSSPATGYYKGREYEEEILTVYTDASVMADIISSFGNLCDQFKAEMMQEQFAVEVNGELLLYDDFVENFARDLNVWEKL